MGADLEPRSAAGVEDLDENQFQAVIRSWVVQALSSSPEKYNILVQDLKAVNFDDRLSAWAQSLRVRALSQSVSYINETDHGKLLNDVVLNMSFWLGNEELADALLELIVNLATSNGALVPGCLDMLVKNFLPPSCAIMVHVDCHTRFLLGTKKITLEGLKAQKTKHLALKNQVLTRVHHAIHKIVELVPSAVFRLPLIVHHRMRRRTSATEWDLLYIENMLLLDSKRISPAIGSRMLLGVVDRLIEIDVQIAWEDILKDEDTSKVLVFQMDIDEAEPADPNGPGSEAQLGLSNSKLPKSLDQIAEMMDQLMDLTLEHLRVAAEQGRVEEMFPTLMSSFKTTVMNTYKSKFTQFLIFYVCSLAPDSCGAKFATFFLETFLDLSAARNNRMSAAAYLASFLSRANFLPMSVIFSSVQRLVNWCVSYTSTRSDVGLHGVFYSACQAVMYILCFRLRDLHADPGHKPLLKGLRLQLLIEHRLNPLKVCLPSVVDEFLRQATSVQLVSHKCMLEPSSSLDVLSVKSYGGDNRLEMFFPFDPYLLRISNRFIQPIFNSWSPPSSSGGDDESCDEDGVDDDDEQDEVVDDDEQEEKEDEDCVTVEDDEEFQNSLDHMSLTSPRMLPACLLACLPIY